MANQRDSLVFFYNEGMVQFGYLILFSPCFTLAPLFSLFTNLLEIRIKLDSMGSYSRRYRSDSAQGIGIWLSIM
jgi:hypothetical protein